MASGFQTNTGGSAGFNVRIGSKGLNTFAVYDQNIGRFIENYYNRARAESNQYRFSDSAGPGPSITPQENAEIDAAIISGKAIPAAILKGRELFEKQADAVINPIRLPHVVLDAVRPPLIPVRAPVIQPTVVVAGQTPQRNPVVGKSWEIPGASSYPPQRSPTNPIGTCNCMNLSNILTGISQIGNTVGALASTYYSVKNAGRPPVAAAPPAVNPAQPVRQSFPTFQSNLPTYQAAAYTPQGGFTNQFAAGSIVTQGANALARLPSMGLLGKALAIAGTLGLSVDVVQAVLGEANHKHRRKRLLTKSDVADISTMASLLGKNSEAFKTWLAVNRR